MSDVSSENADSRPGPGSQPGPPGSVSPGSRTAGHWLPPSIEELQAQFPQYRIDELIGCGGMGAVYKGWQTLLERHVAIKILPPDVVTGDAQFTTRFKQEAKTMARFQHPGIVSIYDAGETPGGLLFIVMEFIEGTDVAHMLSAQGKLSSEYSLAIAAHVCDALQYAHSHGVIHRDIKPANVMINMEGAVKVGDFGLAKATDLPQAGLTRGDMTMGTPDFVAPEALISGIEIDGRADLYALGVMLYNMLTGKFPRGIFEVPSVHTGGDSDVRFDDIVLRALEQDREKRYQSAAEFRQDLDVILTTPKLVAKGTSSSAIPKHELALMRQKMVAKKPLAKRPGQLGHGQKLVVRTVNYVPEKRSVLPALLAGVALTVGGFFAWQKFGNPPKNTGTAENSETSTGSSATVSATPGPQLEGVYIFNGHRYKFLPGPFEKDQDRDKASALKGHLVTIASAEEQKWIEQTFASVISVNNKGICRAGGESVKGGSWLWKGGEPWTYANWNAGFPSSNENHGTLVLKYANGELKWQNTYWSDKRSAIVEWDDTSTPIPLAALVAAHAPSKPAPTDALSFGGHRYKLIRGPASWNEANDRAAGMGGHLATITTPEEHEWVARTFAHSLPQEKGFHFGAYTTGGEPETWVWITGEPWSFENWKSGRPKDRSDARGGVCFFDGKRSQWRASWAAGFKGTAADGESRFDGFLVEWDDNATSDGLAPSTLATAATVPPPPGDSLSFGGHRYQVIKEKTSWSDAKAKAEAMGGHLATLTSQEEKDAVSKAWVIPKDETNRHVFLGGLQETTSGPWTWVTGEPFDMKLWGDRAPDGSGPRLTFYADGKGNVWDDVSLKSSYTFLVEWDDEKAFLASQPKAGESHSFGGHRYQLVRGGMTWDEAKAQANQMGGHLATLTTREEDEWVRATFIEKLPDEKVLHIGGQRSSDSDSWHWITGEPWSYTHWREKATTGPGGIGYMKAIEANQRGWNSWDTRKNITAQSGLLEGKSRVEGFLVEWDEDKGPALAGGAAAMDVPINLLDGVDVKRDAVKGPWEMKPEGLVTIRPEGGSIHQTFEFNRKTPAVYDFVIEFTIIDGKSEVWQIFPNASGPIAWKMGAYSGDPALFGFGPTFDGKNMHETGRTEAVARIPRLKAGEKHSSVVEVRKDSLRAVVDGKEVVKWSGDLARFKFEDALALKDASHFGIGAYGTGVVFHKVELRTRSSLTERLAHIEAQFHEAYERDVTKGKAAKSIADLDKKYLAAIDREISNATKAGSLDDVVALRDEKQRVASKTPLPEADPSNIVAGLKKLRETYRKSIAPLKKQHDAEKNPVYARYDAALQILQTELTQKNQLSDALAVKAKREELDKIRHPSETTPVLAAAPPTVAASVKVASPSEGSKSKDKDKDKKKTEIKVLPEEMLKEAIPTRPFTPAEAAQWALSLGGSARIKKGSGEAEVPDVSRIPKGNFTLLALKLGEKQPLHVVSLAALSGLTELRELTLDNNLITDAGLAFLPKLPKLTKLCVNGCELTDKGLEHIAKQVALTELQAQNNHITGSGLESLTNIPGLAMLKIGSVNLSDEGVPHLASLSALHKLDLDSGKPLKCENLAPLADIKKLKTLVLNSSATDSTVRSLKSLEKLETLHLAHAPISDYAMDGVAGMKGLKELILFRCPNLTDVGFTKLVTLKNLVKLDVGHTRLTDAGFQTLSMKLSEVNDLNCTSDAMSDAGLSSLTNFRKLGRLVVHVRLCTETGTLHIRRASAVLRLISIEQMETLSPTRIEAIKKMLPGVDWGRK